MTDAATLSTPRDAESAGEGGRLVVGRGLFAGPTPEVPDELYVEVLSGRAERRRRHLRVGEYSHVGTNTYYGRFPASYWQRWTTATEVRFEGRTRGAGRLMLRASDTNGVPRTLAVHDTATEDVRLAAPLDRFLDGGGLWIEIVTDDDELVLHDARWTVAAPPVDRGASVVVCTHNRADDCIATLQALTAEHDVLALLDEVVVVDQGTDRIDTREGFADVAARLGDHFRYLPQPNLGGSGGFTRGLYEVVEHGGRPDVDVLFMDDDIRCEPEVVVRLATFGRCVADPTIVGAQMLNLLHPTQVLAGAEYAVLTDLTNGHVSPGAVRRVGRDRPLPRRHQERAGPPGRRGVHRLVVLPHPVRAGAPSGLPAAAVLPVGRRRVLLPGPRPRRPDRDAAGRRGVARGLPVEGLGRLAPVLQPAQRHDHRGAALPVPGPARHRGAGRPARPLPRLDELRPGHHAHRGGGGLPRGPARARRRRCRRGRPHPGAAGGPR